MTAATLSTRRPSLPVPASRMTVRHLLTFPTSTTSSPLPPDPPLLPLPLPRPPPPAAHLLDARSLRSRAVVIGLCAKVRLTPAATISSPTCSSMRPAVGTAACPRPSPRLTSLPTTPTLRSARPTPAGRPKLRWPRSFSTRTRPHLGPTPPPRRSPSESGPTSGPTLHHLRPSFQGTHDARPALAPCMVQPFHHAPAPWCILALMHRSAPCTLVHPSCDAPAPN